MGIAENLKRLRTEAGLSQTRLAKLAKVTQQLISQLESGTNSSTKNLPEIAAALGRQVWEIDPSYTAVPVSADRVPLLAWEQVAQLAQSGSNPSSQSTDTTVTVGDLPPGVYFAVQAVDEALDRVVQPGATMIANMQDTDLQSGRFYVFYDEEHRNAFVRRFHDDPPMLEPVSTQSLYRPHSLRPTLRPIARVQMMIARL
jgi:transcriptional regulator with XRE-family HTH domain